MVGFVARAQPFENLDRGFDLWLFDENLLKPSLQRRVFLDIFSVFVKSRRADALNEPRGEGGL
jgi:hypothetical protein